MGGKQIYKGYKGFIYITGLIFLFVLIAGCKQSTPPVIPKPTLLKKKGMNHLSIASEYIIRKDFEAALTENNMAFDTLKFQSLFQKAIIYSHPDNPSKNYDKAYNYTNTIVKNRKEVSIQLYNNSLILSSLFLQLIKKEKSIEYYKSKYQTKKKTEKKTVKSLNEKIIELENQIEHIKEVDLKIEEKKRNSILKLNTQGSEN